MHDMPTQTCPLDALSTPARYIQYMFFNCSQNFFKLTQFECISSHFVLEKCLLGLSLAKYKMLQ